MQDTIASVDDKYFLNKQRKHQNKRNDNCKRSQTEKRRIVAHRPITSTILKRHRNNRRQPLMRHKLIQHHKYHDHKQYHKIPRRTNIGNFSFYRFPVMTRNFRNKLEIFIRIMTNTGILDNKYWHFNHAINIITFSLQF